MDNVFYVLGVVTFALICLAVVFVIRILWENSYDLRRRYHDYCWLSNMGWTVSDFDNFMENERKNMTDEEAKVWHKKNTKFWYKYICFRKMKEDSTGKTVSNRH